MRIVVLALGLSLITSAIVTAASGAVTGLRFIANTGATFAPMLAGLLWCLRPNARGWCAALVRTIVGAEPRS
ncbi:MAG: hypothetical protein AB1631_34590 [Acidobacteriota bacterium]